MDSISHCISLPLVISHKKYCWAYYNISLACSELNVFNISYAGSLEYLQAELEFSSLQTGPHWNPKANALYHPQPTPEFKS